MTVGHVGNGPDIALAKDIQATFLIAPLQLLLSPLILPGADVESGCEVWARVSGSRMLKGAMNGCPLIYLCSRFLYWNHSSCNSNIYKLL